MEAGWFNASRQGGALDRGRDHRAGRYRRPRTRIAASCCHGGTLTGLILPGFRFVSVRARKDYWLQARQANRASQEAAGHVQARRTLSQTDEDAARRVLVFILRENLSVLARLQADNPGFDALPPTEQGRAYAAVVGDSKLAGLLHQARRGKLTLDDRRARIRERRRRTRKNR